MQALGASQAPLQLERNKWEKVFQLGRTKLHDWYEVSHKHPGSGYRHAAPEGAAIAFAPPAEVKKTSCVFQWWGEKKHSYYYSSAGFIFSLGVKHNPSRRHEVLITKRWTWTRTHTQNKTTMAHKHKIIITRSYFGYFCPWDPFCFFFFLTWCWILNTFLVTTHFVSVNLHSPVRMCGCKQWLIIRVCRSQHPGCTVYEKQSPNTEKRIHTDGKWQTSGLADWPHEENRSEMEEEFAMVVFKI